MLQVKQQGGENNEESISEEHLLDHGGAQPGVIPASPDFVMVRRV